MVDTVLYVSKSNFLRDNEGHLILLCQPKPMRTGISNRAPYENLMVEDLFIPDKLRAAKTS